MEDGKVSVARSGTIEVCVGEGTSMERSPIGRGELRTFSLQCDAIPNGMIPDKFRNFFLSVLIDKDEGIVARVVSVVLMPSFPRVDDVFIVTDRDM